MNVLANVKWAITETYDTKRDQKGISDTFSKHVLHVSARFSVSYKQNTFIFTKPLQKNEEKCL